MEIKSTFGFFRTVHGIPKSRKLSWCLFKRNPDDARTLSLGVYLVGTDKMVDVAKGRFVQIDNYSIEPAIRTSKGDYFIYTSKQYAMPLPKNYAADMYRTMLYSKELLDMYIL